MLRVGEALWGRLQFRDGEVSTKDRPYLVVYVSEDTIGVLTVSSVANKKHKLLYETNYLLKQYKPPFFCSSFVKLDSYMEFPMSDIDGMRKLNGRLNDLDLDLILTKLNFQKMIQNDTK